MSMQNIDKNYKLVTAPAPASAVCISDHDEHDLVTAESPVG